MANYGAPLCMIQHIFQDFPVPSGPTGGSAALGVTLGALGAAVLRARHAKTTTKAFENELGAEPWSQSQSPVDGETKMGHLSGWWFGT